MGNIIKTQKQLTGLEEFLPTARDVGTQYICSDSGKFFIYDKDRVPVEVGAGGGTGVPYTGAIADLDLGNHNITVQTVQLSGGAGAEGTLSWNTDEATMDLQSGGVTYQIGQEIAPLVRNSTGTTIANGTPVRFSGTLGASGRVLVSPAIADGTIPSSYILGVTTEEILNGDDGHVTWFGKVRGIDTTGTPYGQVWNDGDIVYVSENTAGWLTNVKPQAPNLQIFIGVVINSHASNGTLFTRPSWRSSLEDLDDVNGTPLTTTGQILVWDNDLGVFDFTSNISDIPNMKSYTTALRPAHVSGLTIIDSTLGHPIYSDGTNWRDFTGAIPYTATVFFSEDFESGLNSWSLVTDPSAGVYTNQDVTLAGAVATKYNQTYAELSFRGRISSLGVIDDSYFDYKTYSYDAGGGTWYIVIGDFNNGDWIVRESSVDPSSFANGTDLGVSLDSEQVAAFSASRDGENAPFPAGLVSGYSGGTFTATNSWEIGSALSNGGTSSVYISEDEGTSSSYDNTIPTVAHAYKEFTVPAESTGTITLDFDWKCLGETTYDFVRVFVAPTGIVTPTGGSEIGSQYNVVSSTGKYSNSDSWTSVSEDITSLVSAGSTYKLIIQWKNDNVGGSGDVAIDNVSIFY